ncbi:RsmB/NOP family class I SAM-dependent RNA methyltransferase [Lutibaculum baratangense]|uniref:SAM-dependent MTase RsmB/NOP-type domain-containing protein n=1 Tax=Lutibaculum baratangense AMV1 TaxID=631454 RepID=V4RJ66_9HYPH|nr:transcription antitermination factor NusB [Lutibaculum baratangense]ESR26131.1 hypothetical protein N177_0990 [Lutibaculum baratangense AMV1]
MAAPAPMTKADAGNAERGTGESGLAARRAALHLVLQALSDRAPEDPDAVALPAGLEPRDRAFVKNLSTQTVRRLGQIRAALKRFMDRPPHRGSRLEALLAIGACQILFLETPAHAAVDSSVRLSALSRDTARCKGLINAVLRRLSDNREALLSEIGEAVNTPSWLRERWARAYGEETAAAITAAHMVEPPLDLTVKADPASWAERLGGAVTATGSVRLARAGDVTALPGFEDGAWWVQDTAAALPARLLGDVRGKRVADLCAAPGGKTAQLVTAGALLTAVDREEDRMARLRENLARLSLQAETVVADILDYRPAEPFDAVLLDAPCTATGTIRRHPDVPWQRRPADVAQLASLQSALLKHASSLVRPGGTIVFATCSLEPEEGEEQVAGALARGDAERMPLVPGEFGISADCLTPQGDLRTLPCRSPGVEGGMDGFFATRLRRLA